VDSRLRRSPPDRASAVPYGQAGENAMRFPRLAHRSAAAHKLHSTPQQEAINSISGKGETSSRLPAFSLFLPGSCPNYRDRRTTYNRVLRQSHSARLAEKPAASTLSIDPVSPQYAKTGRSVGASVVAPTSRSSARSRLSEPRHTSSAS
jgi:hypothetical protein